MALVSSVPSYWIAAHLFCSGSVGVLQCGVAASACGTGSACCSSVCDVSSSTCRQVCFKYHMWSNDGLPLTTFFLACVLGRLMQCFPVDSPCASNAECCTSTCTAGKCAGVSRERLHGIPFMYHLDSSCMAHFLMPSSECLFRQPLEDRAPGFFDLVYQLTPLH